MSLRSTLRCVFTLGRGVATGLPRAAADRDPFELFGEWFEAAQRAGILLPEAMAVATSTPDGVPAARMMLLKAFDPQGFVFYTNYESRKSQQIGENPHAALVFHWVVLQRQIRIEGEVARISVDESSAYFLTRSRGSRIGAWASRQSRELKDRAELEQRVREHEQQFKGVDIPLPSHWGGLRLTPRRIEFWQGRTNRLHDRLLFVREGDVWQSSWLYP